MLKQKSLRTFGKTAKININIIMVKTTWLHTTVYDYLKIPVKPLFYHIFIVINTIRVKKMGLQLFGPLCTTMMYNTQQVHSRRAGVLAFVMRSWPVNHTSLSGSRCPVSTPRPTKNNAL